MKFKDLIEALEDKVNPASAKKDREERINTKQRALKLAGLDDASIQDHGKPWEADSNFSPKGPGKSNTAINANAAPGDQATPKAVQKEDYQDYEDVIIEEIERSINEIVDIVENEDLSSSDTLSMIALRLREARDVALNGIRHEDSTEEAVKESAMNRIMGRPSSPSPRDRAAADRTNHQFSSDIGGSSTNYKGNGFSVERPSYPQERDLSKKKDVKESFTEGEATLGDGSKIFVNKLDAHCLNKMFSKATNRESLDKLARRNAKEYTSILQFAKSLGESEEQSIDDFLAEADEEEIVSFFVENYSFDELVQMESLFDLSEATNLTPTEAAAKLEQADSILKSILKWLKYGAIAGGTVAGVASIPYVVKGAAAGAAAGAGGAAAYHGIKALNKARIANALKRAKPVAEEWKEVRTMLDDKKDCGCDSKKESKKRTK